MQQELSKKFGLLTAISMVVGIVVGSGVFFKAEKILTATGGDLLLGIYAWIIGGFIMISCAATFGVMATRYEYVNGLVDYAEATMGRRYGFFVGWFMAFIYSPCITSVLAWVAARYTGVLLGWKGTDNQTMTLAGFFLVASYALNALSPVLAGKFQVATTFIKLIPLVLVAVLGTIKGLASGMTAHNFTHVVSSVAQSNPWAALFAAVVAAAFAYEGWIIATSINAELRDSKRNLPIALVAGTLLVAVIYILYYIGLAGTVTNETMMKNGEAGAKLAFESLFSHFGGTALFVFVIISCLGTLNGLMLGCCRGVYALAARGEGFKPAMFRQVDEASNMPGNSAIVGLLLSAFWLLYFFGANLISPPWFGSFSFDSSELPIVTLYALYIPIFVSMMKTEKDLPPWKRFLMPIVSIIGCIFMVGAACIAHQKSVVQYLLVFLAVMAVGALTPSSERSAAQNTQPGSVGEV